MRQIMESARRNTVATALLLTLASALAGCGARTGEAVGPSPDAVQARYALPGLAGRTCTFASQRDRLPPLADLARLGTRGNIAIWGAFMEASDSVTVSVRYDDDGRLQWVRAIQGSVASDRIAPLQRLLLDSFHSEGPADWGVRLRVVGGDVAGVEPSVICPATPRTALRDQGVGSRASIRDARILSSVRGHQYPLEITVDELGHPVDVRIARSTGASVLDQYLIRWIQDTQFHPKVHDGIRLVSTFEKWVYIPRYRR